MQISLENNNLSLQQLYQIVARFSVEQQLAIADHIKKQALAVKWNQFAQTMPTVEPDISEQEIIEEVKAVRAERCEK
ncbi:MAG: hypothetical protein WCP96_11800 [Methylococcaceae bacterium]